MILNFLWSSHKDKRNFHLVKWDTLASPKELGEWGIKNIFLFNKALAAKNVWRSFLILGMWNEVINAKYLKNVNVIYWIRNPKKMTRGISKHLEFLFAFI